MIEVRVKDVGMTGRFLNSDQLAMNEPNRTMRQEVQCFALGK